MAWSGPGIDNLADEPTRKRKEDASKLLALTKGLTRWRSAFQIATLYPEISYCGRFSYSDVIASLAGNKNEEKETAYALDHLVILLVLWLLGVVTSYTLGGFIHILLF